MKVLVGWKYTCHHTDHVDDGSCEHCRRRERLVQHDLCNPLREIHVRDDGADEWYEPAMRPWAAGEGDFVGEKSIRTTTLGGISK